MARSPETSLIMAVISCCDNSVRSSFSCPIRIPAHARTNMPVRAAHFAFMPLPSPTHVDARSILSHLDWIAFTQRCSAHLIHLGRHKIVSKQVESFVL